MKPLTTSEIEAIEANLFPAARPIVRNWPHFPWHRDRAGAVTASLPASSQALAVDFFGTIDSLTSRDAIVGAWMADISYAVFCLRKNDLEVLVSREVRVEPRPT